MAGHLGDGYSRGGSASRVRANVAAQVEESGIKLHIAPDAEMICHALTKGYLMPVLRAEGERLGEDLLIGPNGGRIVMWYDPSEIVQRPDKSDDAILAYDRMEINGAAMRRETGFSESDKPTPEDLEDMTDKLERRSMGAAAVSNPPQALPEMGTESTETDTGSEDPANTQARNPGEV